MQFTITVATPAAGVTPLPAHNPTKSPTVEEAVRAVTGQTPTVTQFTPVVWQWRTWSYSGFAYAHPNA